MKGTTGKPSRYDGYFYLSLCILLWGAIPVLTKKAMTDLDNIQLLFYSTLFSTVIMGILVLRERKWQCIRSYRLPDYLRMGALGFLGNYLYYILLYGALARTSASEGFILAYMWPILVMVLSFILLKEPVTKGKLASLFVSFAGMVIIATKGNPFDFRLTSIYGDLLAVSGAFVVALYSVLGKKVSYDRTYSVFIYFLSALILLVPTVPALSEYRLPAAGTWPWIILNGCLVNGVSYIFWFKALDRCRTGIIANLLYLTPFTSLIYIRLFLDEAILISSVVGLVVIVSGIVIQSLGMRSGTPDLGKQPGDS